ncbi:hypothetical protein [Stenotrophomonas riyadhensis]|uniref:hypothetical protein n=1 Tax=Stenotrophomonas riyadhensis TaxID=2859893 RepID=UPI0033057E4A
MSNEKITESIRVPYDAMGPVDAQNPPAARATLADAQPGGRVRLGDQLPPLPYPNYPVSKTGLQNNAYTASQMWDYARAALSAQPSPGGQGDAITPAMVGAAASVLARWAGHDDGSRWVHEARDALEAALAARQPAKAAPQGCDACDRTGIRQNDEGRNICCPDCDLGRACAGDTRQPVGEPIGFQFRSRQWSDEEFAGPWLNPNVPNRAHYDSRPANYETRSIYAAPPAQAVDLGAAIKAAFPLLTDYGLHHSQCCAYKLIDERHRLHNFIDSQAVGNG